MRPGQDHPALQGADVLLVDLDGTLVDSSAAVGRAWKAFAKRHGLDPVWVHSFAEGRPSRETVSLLAPESDCTSETAMLEHAETADTDGLVALPGAAALLRSGRRLAIVTSCSTALADVRLRAAGLPRPEVVVTVDMVTRGKPDPECFLLALRRLDAIPQRSVALEDAPAGVAAARAAGIRVIALRTTHPDQALAGADLIIDDLATLFPEEPS